METTLRGRTADRTCSLLVVLCLVALSGGCCPSMKTTPQLVRTEPLEQANIPPDLDSILPLFPRPTETIVSGSCHRDGGVSPDGIVEWVRLTHRGRWGLDDLQTDVQLYQSQEAAAAAFRGAIESAPASPAVRGRPGNRCAVSQWVRYRNACVPYCAYGSPSSFVLFQKDKVIVRISEEADGTNGAAKDEVIARLAQTLGHGGPRPDGHDHGPAARRQVVFAVEGVVGGEERLRHFAHDVPASDRQPVVGESQARAGGRAAGSPRQ